MAEYLFLDFIDLKREDKPLLKNLLSEKIAQDEIDARCFEDKTGKQQEEVESNKKQRSESPRTVLENPTLVETIKKQRLSYG
ncbi:MAG: hypothetical protein KGQ36_03700 [Rickettsiales bacterium]|nr:hypothetical protein [Rickettsiales bacterium]